jgi:glycosyltransferase involved in cell wall biosynthesis
MRILFCSQTNLSRELGASKVLIELAEEMEQLGWKCELISPSDLFPGVQPQHGEYPERLRQYLQRRAGEFDVVDYDHNHLPFPRDEFSPQTLFVARSVLLAHHFEQIAIPSRKSLKDKIRLLIYSRHDSARSLEERARAHRTVCEADLVNVANEHDRAELIRRGLPADKIVVIPYGLSRHRRPMFDSIDENPPRQPRVTFVGTFDTRKGATDFPQIVSEVCAAVPGVTFRLLGTGVGEREVLAHFPKRLRGQIEVIPHYSSAELPGLLAPCSVGVFPSYIEGFGLGVLEMLAAAIPVVAYDSPGPTAMLPTEYLVPRGDARALGAKVIRLLQDRSTLAAERSRAAKRSRQFCWHSIARETDKVYTARWLQKQAKAFASLSAD